MEGPAAADRGQQAQRRLQGQRQQQQESNFLLPLLVLGALALLPSLISFVNTASSSSGSTSHGDSNKLRWLMQPQNPLPSVVTPHQITIQLCMS